MRALTEPKALSHLDVDFSAAVGDNFPEHQAVLLPYQARWFDDESQVKVAEKSRRTGLTWAEAAADVLTASKPRARGGRNTFYVGSRQEMALEFIAACALFARAFNRLAGEIQEQLFRDEEGDKDILTYTVRFPQSGFKIMALSSRPSNLRGLQGDVVIDEAAFHDSLNELLKAALALTMWGGRVRIISTHNGVDNEFHQIIDDTRAGRKDYSLHRITLDDALADGLYRRICYVTGQTWSAEAEAHWARTLRQRSPTPEDAAEEYDCVPKLSGGSALSRALIEARMIDAPVVRFTAPAGFEQWTEAQRRVEIDTFCNAQLSPLLAGLNPAEQHAFGEDFGRVGDLTVIAPYALGQQLQRRVPFLVELRNVPFRQQEQCLFYVVDRLPRMFGGALDAGGNGMYLAEQAALRYGASRIQQIKLSDAWYLEHMPKFRAAFEDGLIELPRDADVLNDLRALQSIQGIIKLPKTRTDSTTGQQRHGDAAIALALGYIATTVHTYPIEFQTPRPKHERDAAHYDDLPEAAGAW